MNDIFLDSRKITFGDIYIALKGKKYDGNKFIIDAQKKGAKKIFSDQKKSSFYYPNLKNDLNKILLHHYAINSFPFKIIGITGTNGKTSLSYLLTKLLNMHGYPTKMISTFKEDDSYYSLLTTPRNDELIRDLLKAKKDKISFLIMEVSSIGFCEKRVSNIPFFLGILTNLEKDHLDYHHNIINYHQSKIEFLSTCEQVIYQQNLSKIEVIAQVFKVLRIPLKREKMITTIPGREEILNKEPLILLDYAHTSSAFQYILKKYSLKKKGRLICVFGAGGCRDKTKRKEYGENAMKYADISILTNDNPRQENPLNIVFDIAQSHLENFYFILDRKEAIYKGIRSCNKNDILLILGKGNEDYQEMEANKKHFSDREIVQLFLSNIKNR